MVESFSISPGVIEVGSGDADAGRDLIMTFQAAVPYGTYPGEASCDAWSGDVLGKGGWVHVGSLTVTRTRRPNPGHRPISGFTRTVRRRGC